MGIAMDFATVVLGRSAASDMCRAGMLGPRGSDSGDHFGYSPAIGGDASVVASGEDNGDRNGNTSRTVCFQRLALSLPRG
jgi:hypothetical protein